MSVNRTVWAESAFATIDVSGFIERLVGDVHPLKFRTVPLTSWPCRLMAAVVKKAVAEEAGQTEGRPTHSWQQAVITDTGAARDKITVITTSSRLPDAFDADVFAVLVAKTIADERACNCLWLREVVEELHLDPNRPDNYHRVSASIQRIHSMSIDASGYFDRIDHGDTRDKKSGKQPSRRVIGFRLITSYDTPANEDYQKFPVRVGLAQDVRIAIAASTAITTAPASTGASVSQVIQ